VILERQDWVQVFAPAKINLTLHVTGQREDGYHLLDSLVVFADIGDSLLLRPGNGFSLKTEGPEAAGVPDGKGNLVLRVADLFPEISGASVVLTKNLPVASGIGGGSADAAAAARGLVTLQGNRDFVPDFSNPALAPMAKRLLELGADIPMCLMSSAARVGGVGEQIALLPDWPETHAVLVNPRRALATPSVFKALRQRINAPMPATIPKFASVDEMAEWLSEQRNDLEAAACGLEPQIAIAKTVLNAQPACLLARMSGSGATCFGLFADRNGADRAAAAISLAYPDWWVQAVRLGTQTVRALPKLR